MEPKGRVRCRMGTSVEEKHRAAEPGTARRCMRTQLSPALSPYRVFSHNLFNLLPTAAANPSSVGLTPQPEGPRGAGLPRGSRKWLFLEQKYQSKADCMKSREKVAVPPRATLIPATPNPPQGPVPRSPLQAAPPASACNISSGKM